MTERGEFEFEDVNGNRVTIEPVTSAVALLRVYDYDAQPPQTATVLIGPEDAQRLADAVRLACSPPEYPKDQP
ncbi:hypothetical protein AB0O28_18960 [Microbispora sp. NPDC088329]|uniref:hypothetical protein n=1 Tax=Microbispora sp. NPDC088329 TaxID=3154869 RepID=UPI00341867AA